VGTGLLRAQSGRSRLAAARFGPGEATCFGLLKTVRIEIVRLHLGGSAKLILRTSLLWALWSLSWSAAIRPAFMALHWKCGSAWSSSRQEIGQSSHTKGDMRAIAPSQRPPDCRDMKSQIMLERSFYLQLLFMVPTVALLGFFSKRGMNDERACH
jgi:hypothetical protein